MNRDAQRGDPAAKQGSQTRCKFNIFDLKKNMWCMLYVKPRGIVMCSELTVLTFGFPSTFLSASSSPSTPGVF